MMQITDKQVKMWLQDFRRKAEPEYVPDKMILFGEREKYSLQSVVELIIVSKKFQEMSWPRRIGDVAELWDGFIVLLPLCYTPEEFAIKSRQLGIVRRAVEEGVEL